MRRAIPSHPVPRQRGTLSSSELHDLSWVRTSYLYRAISMRLPKPTRLPLLTLLAFTASLHAQSLTPPPSSRSASSLPAPNTLPANTPTALPVPQPEPPATPAQSPPQRAKISYADNQLTVSASNSSLNQILREVSRLTGIKITGGVTEERVFGDYGPAECSEVLGKLLDGTASNMLLVTSDGTNAPELILTPRTGGATPPNPNASRFDDNAVNDDQPQPGPQPLQPTESQSQPARPYPVPTPITPPTQTGDPNAASPPAPAPPADANQQQSPNGTKTPQQIYDELMRMRRQQQSPPQ